MKDAVEEADTTGRLLSNVFEEVCQPELQQPTLIIDHPVEVSPLAKPHRDRPSVTERFELFVAGREIANAFSELTDPAEQRRRFDEQVEKHKRCVRFPIPNKSHDCSRIRVCKGGAGHRR